jgi:hypothetical protein
MFLVWILKLMGLLRFFSSDANAEPEPQPLDPEIYSPCHSMTRMGMCSEMHPMYEHRVDEGGNYYHLRAANGSVEEQPA